MPSQTTLDADDKAKVKGAVPQSSYKIHFAALARIYYAYPQPNKWSYTGLQGALVYCIETNNNIPYFKMVDLDGTRGVIWDHEVYNGLEVNQDRAFFLSFAGDVCIFVNLYFIIISLSIEMHDWFRVCRRIRGENVPQKDEEQERFQSS